jgi:Ankyrin repeats (3 copies)/Ankyrin repeat
MSITRFKSQDFYVTTDDPKILSPEYRLKTTFTDAGKSLLKEYYAHKYSAQITLLLAEDTSVEKRLQEVGEYITQSRASQTAPARHAFIIQHSKHAIIIAYLKEHDQEGILYADSLGETKSYVTELQKLTGIPIYSVKDARQSSGYGCFTDAFVFARDITGKDPSLGAYRISDLLFQLKERADQQADGHYHIKLPNLLLKTAEIPAFVLHHQHIDHLNTPIHKLMTLPEFRDRYTDKAAVIRRSNEPVTKDMASYMRVKGNNYAKLIQIQYYLNEIKKDAGPSEEARRLFVKCAKTVLRDHGGSGPSADASGQLFELATLFANVRLHMQEEDRTHLHEDLGNAADRGWFPTLYELSKDALDIEKLLRYSIKNAHQSLLEVLVNRVIEPNTLLKSGDNALTLAVEERSVMAVELLLKHGADPARNIYDGNTPLHLAVRVSRQEAQVIKALLEHVADPNAANSDGDTPLHLVVTHNISAIDLLLRHPKIDVSIKNRKGETPLDLASQKKLAVYREAADKMRKMIAAQKGT